MSDQSPKVSIVICTYNQQNFIRETLDSVLAQTYSNLEIIVSDDGSDDDTPFIIQEYAIQHQGIIFPIFHPINTGIPQNINRGMALRTGEYTAWLDGDDVMLPSKIEKQVKLMQAHPEATGCYHDAEVFMSDSGESMGPLSRLYNGSSKLKQGRLSAWMTPRYYFVPSAILARSSSCPMHGFDTRLKYLSEGLFFIEVFRSGILLAINEVLVRYRRHSRNVTASSDSRNLSLEYELMVYAILDARYPELHKIVNRQRNACLLTEAVKSYRENDIKRSNQVLKNIIRDGVIGKALIVYMGLRLIRKSSAMTAKMPYQRPGWINRLARKFLE